jgi:ribosomal small subunit protein bTHX
VIEYYKKNFNFVGSNHQLNKKNMGRGDKKTAKGKRTMGSYGNTRKRSSEKVVAVVEKVEKAPAKKTTKKETAK